MSPEFSDILLYTDASGKVKINVIYEEESFWLNQKMAESTTIRKFRIVQREGNRNVNREIDFYNLDAIIAVGYRVNRAVGWPEYNKVQQFTAHRR